MDIRRVMAGVLAKQVDKEIMGTIGLIEEEVIEEEEEEEDDEPEPVTGSSILWGL